MTTIEQAGAGFPPAASLNPDDELAAGHASRSTPVTAESRADFAYRADTLILS
jgi:hypothetical protein